MTWYACSGCRALSNSCTPWKPSSNFCIHLCMLTSDKYIHCSPVITRVCGVGIWPTL
jgi:hypothetical protein